MTELSRVKHERDKGPKEAQKKDKLMFKQKWKQKKG